MGGDGAAGKFVGGAQASGEALGREGRGAEPVAGRVAAFAPVVFRARLVKRRLL